MTEEPTSPDEKTIRQRLYELVDDTEVSLVEKQRRTLALGREYLGVTTGHIQRRNNDETDTVVVTVGESSGRFSEGAVIDRAATYCRRTVERHSPVALSNVPEQGWADDPAYEEHGLDCYLGTTIFVDGEVYGTVCFTSAAARERDFTADEKAFVELIARLLGRAIEADQHEKQVEALSRDKQRSEETYEALLQLAPNAIFVIDADTGFIETANSQAVSLTGRTETELQKRPILDLFPAENREQYAQLFDSRFTERIQDRFDDGTPLVVRQSDGSEIPVEIGLSRIELDDSVVLLAIVRDVSDRREREQELTRSREFLQQIQEAVDLGGWEIDLESEGGRWTDEVYRIFGLPVDTELSVEEAIQLYHPEDQSRLAEAFERLATKGEPYDLELRIQTVDGEVRWVRTVGRPQYDESNGEDTGPSSVLGIIRDITERKGRERDLRLKDHVIEESTVGITIGDANEPDTPIVYANTGFETLSGYTKEQIMGENCRLLQGQNTDGSTVDEIREAINSEEEIQTEILNYRRNGTPFWNELTISPIMGDESREVTHFVGIQTDVTAQKRRERLIEVLDRVLRHNLRNDMNVVIGFADEIATRTEGETARMARKVKRTALELVSLSETVRGFETDITDTTPLEAHDLRAEIRTVVGNLRAEYPDTEFNIDATGNETVMATDQLRSALFELGDNAAKHGGTTVTYAVRKTTDGQIAIHVRDSGPGIPPIERQVLETGRETPLEHGSGLGLWMVNWIVTSLGGTVRATVDTETTVTITLPSPNATDLDGRPSACSDTE